MRLESLIEEEIHNFLYNISVEYKLDIGDLHYMWDLFNYKVESEILNIPDKVNESNYINKISDFPNTLNSHNISIMPIKTNDNSDEYESPNKEKEKYKKCKYLYARGDKTNKECGSKILDKTYDYCSKHRNKEDKNKTNINPDNIVIQLNKKINKYVHTESGYVFFSREKIVVYSRLVDGVLSELTDEDIAICKLYRFKTDKNLFLNSL